MRQLCLTYGGLRGRNKIVVAVKVRLYKGCGPREFTLTGPLDDLESKLLPPSNSQVTVGELIPSPRFPLAPGDN